MVEESDGGKLLLRVASMHGSESGSDLFDVIVTDNRMPMCNGLSVIHGLRAVRRNTPVVLMTAFGGDETRAQVQKLGAALLDKPFKMEALTSLVRELLSPPPT